MSVASDAWFAFMETAEGGLSLDPNDTGNYYKGNFIGSKLGLTGNDMATWLGRDPTRADMEAITAATAKPIAMALYWQTMNCQAMQPSVGLMVCDFGYNTGIRRSGHVLQELVGTDPDGWIGEATLAAIGAVDTIALAHKLSSGTLKVLQRRVHVEADGVIGPITLAAIAVASDPKSIMLVGALTDAQADAYRTFKQFPRYGRGWLLRTADRMIAAMKLIV